MRRLCTLLAFLSLLSLPLAAQTPTGTIEGTITDASGASIPAATVVLRETTTNESRTLKTDGAGRYTFTFVAPGTYTVTVTSQGFRPAEETGVHVQVAETSPADFKLAVGQANEQVEVTADTQQLDTETSNLADTISSRQILDLPDNGRNPFDFALLAPTVSNVGGASTPHIGGSRNGNNEQLIDGMTNILPENNVGNNSSAYTPVVDSVQEVNVQTSVLEAEYGRFSGGIISLVTKGGTNQLHGSVFEFAEPSALGATPFGATSKPSGYRYQTGGTLGGPIVFPKIYNGHNKTFFFVDFEDQRQASASQITSSIPPAAWLQGDFSSLSSPIFDPLTVHAVADPNNAGQTIYVRDQFPGNIIPAARLATAGSLIAQKVLSYYPKPTNASFQNNFVEVGSTPNNFYHFDTRVDQQIGAKWHSFLRFSHYAGSSSPLEDYGNVASPGGYNGPDSGTAYSLSFSNVVTFNPTLVGEFRYGFSKSTSVRTAYSSGFSPTSLGFPASYVSQGDVNGVQFPHFSFSAGWSDLGGLGYVPLQENPLAHDINASLDKVAGAHTVRVGGEWRLLNLDFYQYSYPSGTFSSDESWTRFNPQDPNMGSNFVDGSSTTGNSIASFLLGLPSSGDISNEPHTVQTSFYLAAYVQDDWKLTRKFTLNYGLRWDAELPRTEQNNQLSYWDPTLASPLGAVTPATGVTCTACADLRGQMVLAGSAASRYGRHQAPTQWKDFAPRIGFAFNPLQRLVIRGGYGLVFQPSALQAAGTSGSAGVEGFSTATNFTPTSDNQDTVPLTDLSNPFPTGYQVPQALNPTCRASAACIEGIDIGNGISQSYFDNVRTPYTQQWNLATQVQIPGKLKFEIAYLGNSGKFLIDGDPGKPYDQLPTSYLSQGSALLKQVANPFYGVITTPGSTLSYGTVQASQLLRKYPQYNGVSTYRKPGADSIYNAFTLRLDREFSQGLLFTMSYTGGKAFDDAASTVSYLGPSSQTYANEYDPLAERSLSAFDVSRILTTSFVYELPIGRGKRIGSNMVKAADLLVGGWQVNGIVSYSTGTPVVIGSYDNGTTAESIFTFAQRPTWNGQDPKLTHQTSKYDLFNPAVFSIPAPYTIGNAPRVISDVRSPSNNNLDSSLIKNTRWGNSDRYNFQFRFELFNTLNHQILGGANTGIGNSSNFGQISPGSFANGARAVQLAGKFYF